jgi:tripartite-type tricarboxylate transporter receptor subunit TctC
MHPQLIAAAPLSLASPASAQGSDPKRVVTVVVPFPQGAGGAPQLAAEMFKEATGTFNLHLPHRGGCPANGRGHEGQADRTRRHAGGQHAGAVHGADPA